MAINQAINYLVKVFFKRSKLKSIKVEVIVYVRNLNKLSIK